MAMLNNQMVFAWWYDGKIFQKSSRNFKKNAWVNLWQNQSKSVGSMVACHQGTRIDAAVSKSASLKKQVARRLSGQKLLQPVTFLICFYHRIPCEQFQILGGYSCRFILKIIQNSWTSNFVLVFLCVCFPQKNHIKNPKNWRTAKKKLCMLGHHQVRAGWFGRDAGPWMLIPMKVVDLPPHYGNWLGKMGKWWLTWFV